MARTVLSGKGQVVIPAEIRTKLGLQKGDRFEVSATGDQVILKVLERNPLLALYGAFKRKPGEPSMVDELLKERKADLEREERKIGRFD